MSNLTIEKTSSRYGDFVIKNGSKKEGYIITAGKNLLISLRGIRTIPNALFDRAHLADTVSAIRRFARSKVCERVYVGDVVGGYTIFKKDLELLGFCHDMWDNKLYLDTDSIYKDVIVAVTNNGGLVEFDYEWQSEPLLHSVLQSLLVHQKVKKMPSGYSLDSFLASDSVLRVEISPEEIERYSWVSIYPCEGDFKYLLEALHKNGCPYPSIGNSEVFVAIVRAGRLDETIFFDTVCYKTSKKNKILQYCPSPSERERLTYKLKSIALQCFVNRELGVY